MKYLKALALAAVLALTACTSGANAADKGGPPTKIDAQGNERPAFHGCYLGASAGGLFLTAGGNGVSASTFGGEVGCDLQRSQVVFGVRAGYDFGESDARFATLGGRVGMLLNPKALLYGTLTLTMDGRDFKLQDSILSAGAGLELYAFTPGTTIFIEGAKDIKTYGLAGMLDEAWSVRAGARSRF